MHQLQCPRQKPKDLDKNMSVRDTSIGIAVSFVTAGSAFGIAVLAMYAFFFFFFFRSCWRKTTSQLTLLSSTIKCIHMFLYRRRRLSRTSHRRRNSDESESDLFSFDTPYNRRRIQLLESDAPQVPFHIWWSKRQQQQQSAEVETSYVWYAFCTSI